MLILAAPVDEGMKSWMQAPIPDLEIAHEEVFTWNIENYRSLNFRERGPRFECGGHPWYGYTVQKNWSGARRSLLTEDVGEYCYFLEGTTSIMSPCTWSKATKKMRRCQTAGMPASSSLWSCGTRTIHRYTNHSVRCWIDAELGGG